VAIKKGTEVQVTFPELSGEMHKAKITRTSGALDPMSGTMQVEIDLDNADGKILSGMYAKILLQIQSRENILSLPILSKIRFQNEDYVFVVEDGKVQRVPIKIGLSDKDYFEVLNDEITLETQVIINGKGLVNPGQVVNPVLKSEK
jgi:multidrug efflux pump subunit AcrA (membrane-fusion protein)